MQNNKSSLTNNRIVTYFDIYGSLNLALLLFNFKVKKHANSSTDCK